MNLPPQSKNKSVFMSRQVEVEVEVEVGFLVVDIGVLGAFFRLSFTYVYWI